ncbi:MAG: phosphodiesterase [Clostridia bacterium]|nr:phosphodiesterase [Clostridia bacterium]
MKIMIASDIHGSEKSCREMIAHFDREKAQKLVLLGDLLYHGPRNDLPEGYNPKAVIAMLNEIRDRLICVKGNCDCEVDQMVLNFPILAECAILLLDGIYVFATHGHHASEDAPPAGMCGGVLLCGHTHMPKCAIHDDFVYMNPGSVTIRKPDCFLSFMTFEKGVFTWKKLADGEAFLRRDMN